jgi:hypothetical protein
VRTDLNLKRHCVRGCVRGCVGLYSCAATIGEFPSAVAGGGPDLGTGKGLARGGEVGTGALGMSLNETQTGRVRSRGASSRVGAFVPVVRAYVSESAYRNRWGDSMALDVVANLGAASLVRGSRATECQT